MGGYNLGEEEVADAMEVGEVEQHCEGDFYEETFIKGAKIYVDRLRKLGAYIYSEEAGDKNKACKNCGGLKEHKKCSICGK